MTKNISMTKSILFRLIPAILVGVLLCVGSLFCQTGGTGNIAVTVTDAAGAVVKGASLTLTNKATNETKTATTSDDGLYTFAALQPGNYMLKTSAPSFGDKILDAVVEVGRTTDANVALAVGAVAATVQVTAEGIQTTSSTFDSFQNAEAIQNLPINGRRFQDLAGTTPTAQVDPSRGQISLAGQRGINTNVSLDGVDYNQPFFGGIRGGERSNSAPTIPQESIREFQVVATGYSAEFGRSTGGVVNIATKSGTNRFGGSAFVVWRPEKLARGNEFTDALVEQKLNRLGIPLAVAPTRTQFGGSVGGRIIKDKVFFFTAYEQQKIDIKRSVAYTPLVGFTPTGPQADPFNFYAATQTPFIQTNDAKTFLGKIDWQINDPNRFSIRYNLSRNNALNGVSVGDTGASTLDPTTFRSVATNGTEIDRTNIVVAQLVSTLSPRLINEGRFQWAKEERPRLANAQQVSVVTNIGELGTRTFLPTTQNDKRYQVVDALTLLSGNHTFKFGADYSKIKVAQIFGFNQFGNYTFSGVNSTGDILNALSAMPGITPGKLGRFDLSCPCTIVNGVPVPTNGARYNQQIGNLQAAYDISQLAFFGQDSWRLTKNFTLNYGLRYEKQFNPSAEANNSPVINAIKSASFPLLGGRSVDPTRIPDSKNQWGPRLGFAWDVAGDGKTVLRAYSGIYYAQTPAIVLAGPFNNFRTPAGDLSVQLGPGAFNASTFSQPAFDAANPQYVAIVGPGQLPNTVYRQFAIVGLNLNNFTLNTLPSLTPAQLQMIGDRIQAARTGPPSALGVFQNASLTGISPDFQNPVSYQFGGGFEREQWRNFIIGIDFAWIKTIHLERNIDINLPAVQSLDPVTLRPIINRNTVPRPVPTLGSIQLRDSTANAIYREVTARFRINKHWGQLNAYYTWSHNESDDDNERDAGGVLYDDPYSRRGEYYASRLDRTHQFVANPVVFFPFGIEFSSNVRLRSGSPLNAVIGSDLNGDNNSGNERPYLVPGVELPRNYYRNRPIYDVDIRLQKRIGFGEGRKLVFSGEIFNILNRSNLQITQTTASGSPTLYCRNSIELQGQSAPPPLSRCGLDGITSVNFLQLRDMRQMVNGAINPNFGKINLLNTPGSEPFQVQLGARLFF